MEETYHVYPVNDLEEHDVTSKSIIDGLCPKCYCKCRPRYKQAEGGFIIIHNSFDGREGVEWVNEILNEKK